MDRDQQEILDILRGFRSPDLTQYPELAGYSRDECYQDFFGGGGLYLAVHMLRSLRLKRDDIVLDLGCGKGPTATFLAKHQGVQVVALDLWTSAEFLDQKFRTLGLRNRILPLNMDATQPLPFACDYFDAIFCMNSFSFYGGSFAYLRHILKHLKPGGLLCIGSEVLSAEFSPEQIASPPDVYSFKLPEPNQQVDVFTDDFRKQHTPVWWRDLFEHSGLLKIETFYELEDADVIYEELVRYEYEKSIDPLAWFKLD